MSEKNPSIFNYDEIYKNQIVPHIDEIKKICALNDIPFFICVAVANSETKTTYKYDGISTGYLDMHLADDQFKKHLCVANGFDVKAPNVSVDFNNISDFLSEQPFVESLITEIPESMDD